MAVLRGPAGHRSACARRGRACAMKIGCDFRVATSLFMNGSLIMRIWFSLGCIWNYKWKLDCVTHFRFSTLLWAIA